MRKGMKLLAVVALVGIMVLGSAVAALGGPVTFGASGVMEKVGDGDSVWSEGMRNLSFQTTAVDGPALYAVWYEGLGGGQYAIKFAKGMDNGREWREDRIIANSQAWIWAAAIDVTADGPNGKGTIHVVYGVDRAAVYYIGSVDGGLTWSAPVNVVASMPEYGTNHAFSIAADGTGNVYIAINPMGGTLPTLVAASSDGLNWGLSQIPGTEASMDPVIDTSPAGNVYVFATGQVEDYFSKSTNGGQSWSTVALPQNSNNGTVGIAVKDDLNIYVSMGSWNDLVVAYTHNGGAQATDWTFVTVVDQTSGNIFPSIALSPSGDPNVSWAGNDGWLRLSRGKNGGTSWTTYSIPVENPYDSSLAVDADGKAHIMFDWDWPDGNTIQITHEQ